MSKAPIALFTYARKEHAETVVNSLLRNKESVETDLIVFSDGPKSTIQESAVKENRNYIRTISGFKSIRIVERDCNWGLARSLIDGITTVIREYGKVIVVEDDLIVAPHFLEFMNIALDKYEKEEKVYAVSGYFSISMGRPFFLRNFNCWGWATWKRAWDSFNPNASDLKAKLLSMHSIRHFDIDFTYPYYRMLQMQEKGMIDSWAIRCYAFIYVNEGLVLYPSSPLVSQNGMDGSGTHCGVNNLYENTLEINSIELLDVPIKEDTEAYKQLKFFCRKVVGYRKEWLREKVYQLACYCKLIRIVSI